MGHLRNSIWQRIVEGLRWPLNDTSCPEFNALGTKTVKIGSSQLDYQISMYYCVKMAH